MRPQLHLGPIHSWTMLPAPPPPLLQAPVLQTLGMSVQLVDLPACAQRGPYIAPGFMLYVLKGRHVLARCTRPVLLQRCT